ncbi:TetR family transcriptional regulator [Actinoplanes sp. OR16]|uniref:TetR/AcrR family transcriptional regulator n=1 Tax=Actinoplanes sp. OR16 TaxID=946334 RepID=UPI000F6CC1C6|nr:TetR/AcrR family transcriptional regulator [Actinoplanes sp. OR16]BBH69335.1 TetR family transcriptional regulator [Actinoplanes sp. OR16]
MSESKLRADAARNRQRVLAAAAEVFGELGIDVPMAAVARRAGVGIATLIRNFPTRGDLLAATFGDAMTGYADRAARAAGDPDPWTAFGDFITWVCAVPQRDRGFGEVLTRMFPEVEALEAERQRGLREFVRLVRRAKDAKVLRPDFSPHDLPLIMLAAGGVARPGVPALAEAADRLVAYFLQSCAAGGGTRLPAGPDPRALYRALESSS